MQLHAAIAAHKHEKSGAAGKLTELHHLSQKAALYEGFTKTYEAFKEEDSFTQPAELKQVQLVASDVLGQLQGILTEEMDLELTIRRGNQQANAALALEDGTTIAANVPVEYLLYLEKKLTDLRTFVEKMPTLDPAVPWQPAPEVRAGILKGPEAIKQQMRKVQEPIVLYPATPEHPAQAQLIVRDVIVGQTKEVKFSSALHPDEKRERLRRVDALLKAVKVARQEANAIDVHKSHIASAIFSYLLA